MFSDDDFEEVSSDQLMPEATYEEVPQNQQFKIIIDQKKIGYTLKSGKKLPYTTTVKRTKYVHCTLFNVHLLGTLAQQTKQVG